MKRDLGQWWHRRDAARWWMITLFVAVSVGGVYLALALFGTRIVRHGYTVSQLLKDGADVGIKVGALVGLVLGAYKYLYRRYDPLVFQVACGLIPYSLMLDLWDHNQRFFDARGLRRPTGRTDGVLRQYHDLPIVVVHERDMSTLKIRNGSKVDLAFTKPNETQVWAIAYVFSFESLHASNRYDGWPIGVSLSLRRLFGIERPFQTRQDGSVPSRGPMAVPKGWQLVRHDASDLALWHQSLEHNRWLVWIASDAYSIRFRNPSDATDFSARDSLRADRIMEYVGVSLRMLRRSWFRYQVQ